jgi:hypothetical protein
MDVFTDAHVDADTQDDGRTISRGADRGRSTGQVDSRRRLRRRMAIGLAAAGVIAIVVGLSWSPGTDGGDASEPQPVTVNGGVTQNTAKDPSNSPGGVGENPEKTGLPAIPADGGRVRTGTKEEGCFATMREYLDAWDRTGVEPDPCFIGQLPTHQQQPDGVVRSYNGERF